MGNFTQEELAFIAQNPDAFTDEEIAKAHADVTGTTDTIAAADKAGDFDTGGQLEGSVFEPMTPYKEYVRPILKPTVETAGMVAGEMAGSPLGPAGAIGGAGLGYAGAKKGYDFVEKLLQGKTQKPIGQGVAEIPADVAEGVTAQALPKIAGAVAKPVLKAGGKVGSWLSNVPYEDIKNYFKFGMPKESEIDIARGAAKNLSETLETAKNLKGAKVRASLPKSGEVRTADISAPFQEAVETAKTKYTDNPTQQNLEEYKNVLEAYDRYFKHAETGVIPESITPKAAFDTQQALRKPALFDKSGTQISDVSQKAIKNAASRSYGKVNQALDNLSNSLTGEAKKEFKDFLELQDQFGTLPDNPESMARFLRNYNKSASYPIRKDAVAKLGQEFPELGLDKAIRDIGVISSFKDPSILPTSGGGTTSTSRSILSGSALGAGLRKLGVPEIIATPAGMVSGSPLSIKALTAAARQIYKLPERLQTAAYIELLDKYNQIKEAESAGR